MSGASHDEDDHGADGALRKLTFSADDLPAEPDDQARFALWRDIYCDRHGDADLARLPDRPFHAHSEYLKIGELGVTRFEVTLQRWARDARQVAADVRDDFLIGFNRSAERKPTVGYIRGQEVVLAPGNSVFYTNAEPGETLADTETVLTGLIVPRARVAEVVANVDDLVGTVIDQSNVAMRHLAGYVEFLLDSADERHDAALTRKIETTLLDLVALSLGPKYDAAAAAGMRGLRAARVQQILAEIGEGFSRPSFSPAEVAQRIGLSTRYLHELLQETGVSFTERVLELRLQKARALLIAPRHLGRAVSEIAHACGFNEVSYFNRRFRARFGASPTQCRGGRED